MAYNTRKHDAKMRIKKKAEARKAAMFARATKSVGAKPKLDFDPDQPRAGVIALSDYVGRLEVLQDDLEAEFGDLREFASASSWLRTEISLALDALVKLKIKIEAGA